MRKASYVISLALNIAEIKTSMTIDLGRRLPSDINIESCIAY